MIGGWGITGPGTEPIAPERRCAECGLLLGERETSPCEKCEGAAQRRIDALAAQWFDTDCTASKDFVAGLDCVCRACKRARGIPAAVLAC